MVIFTLTNPFFAWLPSWNTLPVGPRLPDVESEITQVAMTTLTEETAAPLARLATYLAARREALLNYWRTTCETDATLKGVKSLSREEFNNKVSLMLNRFQRWLGGLHEDDKTAC